MDKLTNNPNVQSYSTSEVVISIVDFYKHMSYASDMNNNRNNLIFAVSALIIALSIGYYFVIFLPKKEQEKINLQKQIQTEAENKRNSDRASLNSCLDAANNASYENWNKYCEIEGLKKDCNLPNYQSEKVNNYTKELKDECFKKYPQ